MDNPNEPIVTPVLFSNDSSKQEVDNPKPQ